MATGKGYRDAGKNVEETKTPSQSMKIKQLLQDSTPQPWWNPLQKMDHLPVFQLLSYLKFLEYLIHKEFSQIFWGISTLFSESVVATAHVLRRPSLAEHKTVRFRDACRPARASSKAQGPPECSQEKPLPAQLVTPSLLAATKAQLVQFPPNSTPNKTPPCFRRKAFGIPPPTTEKGIQVSLSTENHACQHGQYWKHTKGDDIQKHQAAFTKSNQNLTLHNEAVRSGSILPEHCHMTHKNEEPQNEGKEANVGQEQGTPITFLPSWRVTQIQGNFPANSDHCKSRPQLSQPAESSILNHKSYMWIKMRGSGPMEVPLREVIEKSEKYITIKKGIGLGSKHPPCASSSTPGKGLNPRNPTLKSDELSDMNPAEHHSLNDSKTERKLALNITELPVKRRRKPYLQILETRDLTSPGGPASNHAQVVFPSSPICDSKEEYYSKAAMILEKLHHQDPGGTRVESASAASVESALSLHSGADVQETQKGPPPAASDEPSKEHPDSWQRHLSIHQPDFCLQANPQQNRTIQGSETGSLQQNTCTKIDKHPPRKGFQYVDSDQPCCRVIVLGQDETVPPSAARPSNIVDVKEEPSPERTVSLGSSDIHNGQSISPIPRDFGSLEPNKHPGNLQNPTLQHSKDSVQKPQSSTISIDLKSKEQPEPCPVRNDPDAPSTVHPAKASLPSQHSMPSFQNTWKNPRTIQALEEVLMRRHAMVETGEICAPKGKLEVNDSKGFHPHEEKQIAIRSTDISQGERLGRVSPSIPSSTQTKDTTKTWIPGKGEAPSKSSWKNITRTASKYGTSSTKYIGQGDSLETVLPTSGTEQTQEVVTKNKILYNTVAEIQSLVNALVQILENTEGYPPKVQGCKVESLTSQLDDPPHSPVGLYDTIHSRAASRLNCGHVSPEINNYPFTYMEIEDQLQSGIKVQRAYDPSKIRTKAGIGCCPYSSLKGHNHSFRYREIRDEQQQGIVHEPFHPDQSTKKGMGCASFLSPIENRPVKHRGSDCSSTSVAAQQTSDTRWT